MCNGVSQLDRVLPRVFPLQDDCSGALGHAVVRQALAAKNPAMSAKKMLFGGAVRNPDGRAVGGCDAIRQ